MRKIYIAGAVLLLVCAAIFFGLRNLSAIVNANRGALLSRAEQALGRKITVGDMEVSVLRGIGLKVRDFTVADDPAFSSGPFIRARELQIHVKLWPLFKKHLEIKKIVLREPVISVIRDQAGVFNFSSIGKREKSGEDGRRESRQKPARRGIETSGRPAPLFFPGNIHGGEVRYRDEQDHTHLDLKQVDFTMKPGGDGKPFSVNLRGALFSRTPNLKITSKIGSTSREEGISRLRVDGVLDADSLDIDALRGASPRLDAFFSRPIQLSGVVAVNHVKFNGTVDNLALNGAVDAKQAGVVVGKSFSKPAGVPLDLSADVQYANETIYFRNSDLRLGGLALSSKGEVHLGGEPSINISLDSRPASLEGWHKLVPALEPYRLSGSMEVHAMARGRIGTGGIPEIHGSATLTGVGVQPPKMERRVEGLNTTIVFNGQSAETKAGVFQMGDSKIHFAASIEKFSPLVVSYRISAGDLRLADFLRASAREALRGGSFKNFNSAGRFTFQEKNFVYQGSLASGGGRLVNISFNKLEGTVAVADKSVRLRGVRLSALGGTVTGDGEYRFGDSGPQFSANASVQGIDINELYRSIDPKMERDVRGRLNAAAVVSGAGANWEEIKPSLRGRGEAEIIDGTLLNFNLANTALSSTGVPALENLISPRVRKKYPETFESKDTRFRQLKAHFEIADGRMMTKDLRAVATDYGFHGEGWASFERKINFHSALVLSAPLSADLAQSMQEVRLLFDDDNQFTMPLVVSGKLPRVKAKPDSRYLARLFQRGSMRQGLEALQRGFFGKQEPPAPEENNALDTETTQKPKKRSTGELILKGLEGLFKR